MTGESDNKQPTSGNYQRAVLHIVILLLCVSILILARLFAINGTDLYLLGFEWPHRCPLFHTLGVKCALCGMTRSFSSLADGNLTQSLKFHALGPAIFAFTCLQIPYRIWALIVYPKKLNKIAVRANLTLAAILAMAVFVNWLIYLGGLIL